MIQALGTIVRRTKRRSLSTHDFYLGLTDVLLDLVDRDLYGPSAVLFSQLACSLAHDFVNLATLAGQLLWYVSIAPVRTGTPDSIRISLAAESYFVFLRTAYDGIAGIILNVCIDPKKRGQIADGKSISFHGLVKWAKDNPTRLPKNLEFLPDYWDFFMELRDIRDKLVHFGYDVNVLTNNVAPSFGLMSTGEVELHLLRTPRTPMGEKGIKLRPLLPFLKHGTEQVLHLAEQVTEVIIQLQAHTPSRSHILNGVYIPALNQILSYKEPQKAELQPEEEKRRKLRAWFLFEAGDYLESLNFGYPDGFWLAFVTHAAEVFGGKPPLYLTRPKYPPYRDSEILTEWWLIFKNEKDQNHYGLLLRDASCLRIEEPAKLKEQVDSFKARFEVKNTVLVVNSHFDVKDQVASVVAASDPLEAANKAFELLTQ